MGKGKRKYYIMITCAGLMLLLALLGGCTVKENSVSENFIGTAEEDESDRIAVTITTSIPVNHFAEAVEERFENVRLIQDSYAGSFKINEHIARVKNKDMGDLVLIKAGHIPKADLTGLLLDLSTQSFPASYNANALQMDEEGHIYLLPGPLSFNCNIYNRTLFEENGWSVPKTYDEYLKLAVEIDKSGIRGYRFVFHDSSLQSFQIYNYCVYSALDTLTQVDVQMCHNRLMSGEKVSLEPMLTAFQDLERLMDAGLVRTEDLEFTGSMCNEDFLNRKIAITSGEIDLLRTYNEEGTDEYCFMPHFSMTDGQGWLLNLGYYFGANQELSLEGNEEKREAVMEILSFMASDEGQQLLIKDGLGMVSATRGAEVPDESFMEDIRIQIESGQYIMRPGYDMFTSVLETEIAAFIRSETTSDEILEKCQKLLEKGGQAEEYIGSATEDFTVLQTANLKADALRTASGTDVALIGMAEADFYAPVGGTRSRLYEGGITNADITRITQIELDVPLLCSTASVTGSELLDILEHGATSIKEQETGVVDHFHPFAVSGLTLTYDTEQDEGHRVSDVKLNQNTLNPESTYTVAFLSGVLTEEETGNIRETDLSMTDVLKDYIQTEQTVTPSPQNVRFR